MKIEQILPTEGHIAYYEVKVKEEDRIRDGNKIDVHEDLHVRFMGLVDGDWVALVLNHEGKLEVAAQREGFIRLYEIGSHFSPRDPKAAMSKQELDAHHLLSKGWVLVDGWWFQSEEERGRNTKDALEAQLLTEKKYSTKDSWFHADSVNYLMREGWQTRDNGLWENEDDPGTVYKIGDALAHQQEIDTEYLKKKGWIKNRDGSWDHPDRGEGWTFEVAVAKEKYFDALEKADQKVEDDSKT